MVKLFNYTKWIPLVIYDCSGNKYLLLGRKNLNNGMIRFRNIKLNGPLNLLQTPVNTLDYTEQFKKLFDAN